MFRFKKRRRRCGDKSLNLQILNVSVVIVAQEHNPTILHPAFLKSEGIVPSDWELAEPPICTPPVSIVKFANQIVFMVESTRFQVVDNSPPKEMAATKVPELTVRYVRKLPHVRYTAVGVNIGAFIECASPESKLLAQFLKPGPWNEEALRPEAVGLNLKYPLPQGELHLSLNAGRVKRLSEPTERHGIIVNANYHKGLPGKSTVTETEEAISLFPQRWNHFTQTISTIFEQGN